MRVLRVIIGDGSVRWFPPGLPAGELKLPFLFGVASKLSPALFLSAMTSSCIVSIFRLWLSHENSRNSQKMDPIFLVFTVSNFDDTSTACIVLMTAMWRARCVRVQNWCAFWLLNVFQWHTFQIFNFNLLWRWYRLSRDCKFVYWNSGFFYCALTCKFSDCWKFHWFSCKLHFTCN